MQQSVHFWLRRLKVNALNVQCYSVFTSDNDLFPSLDAHENWIQYDAIGNIELGVHGVQKQLEQLNVCKSTGPDGIRAQVLNMLSHKITPMLSFIFQQNYNTRSVPSHWTEATMVPIFKSGSREDPSNYWPILLINMHLLQTRNILFLAM